MKKSYLPLLLIAGAAIAFYAFRRRPRVTVEAGPTEKITEEEFTAPIELGPAPTVQTKGATSIITNLFSKGAALLAQRKAVRSAVKTKTASRRQAKAVTKQLAKGIRVSGFNDNNILV